MNDQSIDPSRDYERALRLPRAARRDMARAHKTLLLRTGERRAWSAVWPFFRQPLRDEPRPSVPSLLDKALTGIGKWFQR